MKLMKIAVTGGICTGKSSFCSFLSEQGQYYISADIHAKKALLPSSSIYDLIAQLFNTTDYKLTSSDIARRIFKDKQLKAKFEKIMWPFIRKGILEEENQLINKGAKVIYYEIPLLFENNRQDLYDFIILLTCDSKLQIHRLINKSSISESEALLRIKSQWAIKNKVSFSDIIVENNSSLDYLKKQAHLALEKISVIMDNSLKK